MENNLAEPDLFGFEIKAHREEANSYVTLFTKAPTFPKKLILILIISMENLIQSQKKKIGLNKLHTSIFANSYNTFANKLSFKLINDRVQKTVRIGVYDKDTHTLIDDTVGYNYDALEKILKIKLHNLFYVGAKRRYNCKGVEEFNFNTAEIYTEPSFEKFLDLIDDGTIMFDIRIGSYANGKTHDHGSGFRILQPNIKLLYGKHETV